MGSQGSFTDFVPSDRPAISISTMVHLVVFVQKITNIDVNINNTDNE